ncbi:MAG: putative salt-induced outer membrane protein YdiY [Lysobacterales bacterium]|jgi:putative salt-induced outer membrane protein YdiY
MKCLNAFLLLVVLTATASADEVYLKNGDKVTGSLNRESATELVIDTEALGVITIGRNFVDKHVTNEELAMAKVKEAAAKKDVEWTREVSVGISQTGGNTEKGSFSGNIDVNRKTDKDEWTAAYSQYLASSNKKQDARKSKASLRYAASFGAEKEWFHFYKVEADQDRFSNIDYRILPSGGIGYWFADTDSFKANVETAFGYEHTSYRDGTKSKGEMVVIPSAYIEKEISDGLRISEKITIFPSLEDLSEVRLISETKVSNTLSDNMYLTLRFIDEYDSAAKGSSEKNDYRFVSSIDYAF